MVNTPFWFKGLINPIIFLETWPYRVSFEVVHETTISYLMNYPNPFSTSTRFVFTLTGSEVPDDMIIQIMTINGKIVREITEQEFGRIYIGRNISKFAWNGTDEFEIHWQTEFIYTE